MTEAKGKRVSVYKFTITGQVVIPDTDDGTVGTGAQAAVAAATKGLVAKLGDAATVSFRGGFGAAVVKE